MVFNVWVAFEVGKSVVDFTLLEGARDVFAGIRSWCHCGSSQYRKRFYSLLDVSTRCNQPLGANRGGYGFSGREHKLSGTKGINGGIQARGSGRWAVL
jgi:hypothetical protein